MCKFVCLVLAYNQVFMDENTCLPEQKNLLFFESQC